MQENISTLKPFNIGRATHAGITAAFIVRAGFQGPLDTLEGKFGFLHSACDTYKPEVLSLKNDSNYNICGSYHKPYASCRHTHGAIYAALRVSQDNDINWRDIEHIVVDMYAQGVKGHDHTQIPSIVAGKMSTPFCIALALVTGKIGISSFNEETLNNSNILELTEKVTVLENAEMTSWVPNKRAARVSVTMKNNDTFIFQADYAYGEPELPMSMADFRTKVTELALSAGRTEDNIQKIIDAIITFDGNVSDLVKLIA